MFIIDVEFLIFDGTDDGIGDMFNFTGVYAYVIMFCASVPSVYFYLFFCIFKFECEEKQFTF